MSSDHSLSEVMVAAVATTIVTTVLMIVVSPFASAQQVERARVFTVQQASDGKAAFEKSCAACHMRDLSGDADAPQLAGTQFMSGWRTRSVKELFQYMSTAMPPGGSPLSAGTYASITAYILQSNGAVAGGDDLTAATGATIGSVAPPGKPGT